LAVWLALCLTGCANLSETANNILAENAESVDSSDDAAPEFEFGEDTVVMGGIRFRPFIADSTADPTIVTTYEYEGGEFSLPYTITASGLAKNAGVRLFLDGEPIPFKINDPSAKYEYIHTFDIEKDNEPFTFTFIFTPNKGQAGDTFPLTAGVVYHPDYKPDMMKSSGYGMFHDMNNCHTDLLHFVADSPAQTTENIKPIPAIQAISQKNLVLTSEILSIDWVHGGAIVPDELEGIVRQNLVINGNETLDNYKIENDEPVRGTLYLCGIPGVIYKTSFYLDHQPICDAQGNTVFLTTLQQGKTSIINLELPADQIGTGRTFYTISMPCNKDDFPNLIVRHIKTGSVFLYQ
jgi:hypothetical protein